MKKLFSIIIILAFTPVHSQPKYVTTIYPFQEILNNVIGDRGEVLTILPPGASPHTYELRPSDIRTVASARALFFGSEKLDGWALKIEHDNRFELLEFVPEDSLIYFHQNNEQQKSEVHLDQGEHNHSSGVDPHFWTDPLTVKAMLPGLTEKLCNIDPGNCKTYQKNSRLFANQLDSLHAKLTNMLASIPGSKVMISHPFFQYFFKRYGIELIGVIEKVPGREPTPREIKALIEQIKPENIKAIFDHNQLPDRAAKIIAESSGIKVFHLDPIGGVAGRQTYGELIISNAKIIAEALR